jgi:putative membrane protein
VKWLLARWVILAAAIAFTAWVFPGIDVDGGLFLVLEIAAVFAVLNVVLGSLLRLLTLPLIALTFGLFAIVLNAILFLVTAAIIDDFEIDGLLPAIGAAVVVGIVSALLEMIFEPDDGGAVGVRYR